MTNVADIRAAMTAGIPELRPDEVKDAVRMVGVTKTFGTVTALDDVTVDFTPGEVNVLLGLSGSGKSTLLRHINGLQLPTSGSVRTLGIPVQEADAKELRVLRSRVGMIFQHFHLVGSMSVLENVCTGRLGALRGPRIGLFSYPRRVKELAMEHLARVGLADDRGDGANPRRARTRRERRQRRRGVPQCRCARGSSGRRAARTGVR